MPHGVAAYVIWGLLPIYFKLVHDVPALEMISHRIFWSLLLMLALLASTASLGQFGRTLRDRRAMTAMSGSAVLIGMNWLAYIWAIAEDHVIAASLGYFLNPLVNVTLGVVVLKEKLRRPQMIAILIAGIGVAVMAASALDTLWVSLVLALTFAFYGLIRKTAVVGPRQGLAAETLILAPAAACYLAWLTASDSGTFGSDVGTSALLMLSGVLTSVPLLLFATAARRMPLSALGLLQYVAPSLQFLCGIFLFGETLSSGQMLSFALIWIGLAVFAVDGVRQSRASRLAAA